MGLGGQHQLGGEAWHETGLESTANTNTGRSHEMCTFTIEKRLRHKLEA